MTNQQGAPEALRLADSLELCWGDSRLDEAAAELRRLHAENERLAALVAALQPATHVQQSAEIEHVAGDVSKNGPESNMSTQQPAPAEVVYSTPEEMFDAILTPQPSPTPQADSAPSAAAAAGQHFCPGIPRPECNYLAQCESVCNKCGKLHSTRFLEDRLPAAAARRWSTYEQAIADPVFQTARSIMGTENIGQDRQLVKAINHVIDSQHSPTPQADSQPAPARGESAAPKLRAMAINYPEGACWDKLDAQTCMEGALEIEALRAARAPADSVTAPAEESRCANCGKSAADSHERIADYPEEGEWFCSAQCKDQHDELDCPHLTHNGYRHPAESERLIACERALRSLASWLSVGGFNAPTVDAKVFEEKIRWGVEHLLQATPPAQAADSVLEDAARIEQIAQQWDGCMYDAVVETIDIGQAIRDAARKQGANHD